jgi:hypothetical protein
MLGATTQFIVCSGVPKSSRCWLATKNNMRIVCGFVDHLDINTIILYSYGWVPEATYIWGRHRFPEVYHT